MLVRAVLDANVLYPASLRDILLGLAEAEFYAVVWSDQILDEVARNLVEDLRASQETVDRMTTTMNEAFPEASVASAAITALVPSMANDEKDRHVLAAAVSADAQFIVTRNLKDFPLEACSPHGVEPISPDAFLCAKLELAPELVKETFLAQVAALRKPPLSSEKVLELLATAGAPDFASRLRHLL